MGLNDVHEIVIGLIFIYFVLSVACSNVNEFVAQETGCRGEFLREGLINLVRDRWTYLRIINHPLLSNLYRDVPGKPRTPAYIPSANFAHALLDLVVLKASQLEPQFQPGAEQRWRLEDLRKAAQLCKAGGYSVGDALLPLIDSAQSDGNQARKNIEAWFDGGMQRVSGWYKSATQRRLFSIGLLFAVLLNIDPIGIVEQASRSTDLHKMLKTASEQIVETKRFHGIIVDPTQDDIRFATTELKKFASRLAEFEALGLPIGYACLNLRHAGMQAGQLNSVLERCRVAAAGESPGYWAVKIVGWLITGLIVALAAPFWFDLRNKIVTSFSSKSKTGSESGTEPPKLEL